MMKFPGNQQRRRTSQGRVFRVESLEERALLSASAETFSGPSLDDLIALAAEGDHRRWYQHGINAVAVAFAGNTSYTSSNGTGTLTVS